MKHFRRIVVSVSLSFFIFSSTYLTAREDQANIGCQPPEGGVCAVGAYCTINWQPGNCIQDPVSEACVCKLYQPYVDVCALNWAHTDGGTNLICDTSKKCLTASGEKGTCFFAMMGCYCRESGQRF